MLLKWITCRVTDPRRFGTGQREWRSLRGHPGFGGQFGGWSVGDSTVAQVFALWDTPEHYQSFMDGDHDRVAAAQREAVEDIRVRLLTHRLDMAHPPRTDAAELLRFAHCRVRPDRVEHFLTVQREIWNPGMSRTPGMLGGLVAEAGGTEFLVLSAWRTAVDHAAYVAGPFPALRQAAEPETDVDGLTGGTVAMVADWTVAG